MSVDSRQILLLEKRIELLEKYQAEILLVVLDKKQELDVVARPNFRGFILRNFSFIDQRLIKYQKYNKMRRWIYKRYK